MAHDISKLDNKMGTKRVAKAKARAKEVMAEMFLTEIRKEVGFTQEKLAQILSVSQPSLSKLESQDDMQISTLARLIDALGGQLEIIAHMPNGVIRISPFCQLQNS